MAHFKFEGDIENLAEPQRKLVENVLQRRGFHDGKVIVEPVGQKGYNYVSLVKRFTYKQEDGSTFKMIGKLAPVDELQRSITKTDMVFYNEAVMYNLIIPKLNELQNAADVNEDDKIRFPICYGVVNEAPNEFILLEDLSELRFEMLDRFQPLSYESIRLVIKDLAIYHSLSYVFKNNEPETYEYFVGKLSDVFSAVGEAPEMQCFLEVAEETLLGLLHDMSQKYRNQVKGSLTKLLMISKKIDSYERGSKYSVVQHGNCWNNNVMFRYEDSKPVQDIMIDYQLSKGGNPVSDILFFLFNCTDHAARKKHFKEWIDYYHEILEESLNNHGLKANRIFPKDQLDAELRRYGKLMVSLCLMRTSMNMRDSEDTLDVKVIQGDKEAATENGVTKIGTSNLNECTIMRLREKIVGIMDTAFEFGLVNTTY